MAAPLHTIDDLIANREGTDRLVRCIAYPRSPKSLVDYEVLTINELDGLVESNARYLATRGLTPVVRR